MKMRIKNTYIILVVLLLFSSVPALCQSDEDNCSLDFSIPELALVDIEPSGLSNISLTLTTNPESGLPVTASGAENDELWINYTSCLATGSNNRSVAVQVSSGSIPSGVALTLLPSSYSGNGEGDMGTPVGPVNLSSTPQTLITNIGRCYTGDGQNNGHRLNYSLSISDYQALRYNQSATIQITFTLRDN